MTSSRQSTGVAIGGRAVLIEGPPGIGKSSLALSLIDRGARLIGDDGLLLDIREGRLVARPHPNTAGLIEIRNLGLVSMPVCHEATISLLIRLDREAPRYLETAGQAEVEGIALPTVGLWPEGPNLALKVEIALDRFGLIQP